MSKAMFIKSVLVAVTLAIVVGSCAALPTVAFHATMTRANPTVYVGRNIIFPVVKLNQGNAYNPATGIFTCPVRGIYSFSAHLQRRKSARSYTQVMLYKTGRTTEYLHPLLIPGSNYYYVSDAVTVTTNCNAGEKVYLKVHVSPSGRCEFNHTFNRFSGFLISAY